MLNSKIINHQSLIKDYIFANSLFEEDEVKEKSPKPLAIKILDKNNDIEIKDKYLNKETQIKLEQDIIKKANKKAEEIILRAQDEITKMKNDATHQIEEEKQKVLDKSYEIGFKKGKQEGYEQALSKNINKMEEENSLFLEKLNSILNDIQLQKQVILDEHLENMCDVALNVAQKVIGISLDSSGKVIEKMILDATEKLNDKQWVRIHISSTNLALVTNSNIDIIAGLKRLSDNIKIISMENEPAGSCIIELPDQIIDITPSTQIENVKDILQNELF